MKQNLDRAWVVMKVTHRGSRYGNIIEEVCLANAHGEIAHTYLDQENQNYRRWRDIIDLYDRGCGVIISGLRYKKNTYHKKTNEPLINADSPVVIKHVDANMQNVLDDLAELLNKEPQDPKELLFSQA